MITLATLAALVPLAFGVGVSSDLHRPLAGVVLGGLAVSTLATLVVVPLVALWADSRPGPRFESGS